ncbi:MAG TPA: NADH-quinone oxidoreductase subunit C [Actinomycetales bacterium]|nr:NADH-quinone oxidoreductase subunit C [Actinomycetales bacterium]
MTTGDGARQAPAHVTVVEADQLAGRAQALLDGGHRLALVAAHEEPDAFRVVYAFTPTDGPGRHELVLRTPHAEPAVPSLAAISFSAGRFEREMRDMYGIVPLDHPLPRRLIRHRTWPQAWYPMRSDAGEPPPFQATDPFPFLTVGGPGVYEIPVGPVHAGIIEPGHFRFSVVGETILKLKARLWFTHKGIEKLAEGRPLAEALRLAERVSGDTSFGHALAYCLAVEDALGWSVPEPVARQRALLLEMERLYNHVTDLGALCKDAGHGILDVHAHRVREQLVRINAEVTGHRLLRGAVVPGGVRLRALPDAAQLRRLADEVAEIVGLALGHSVVRDRFTGTAVLTEAQVRELGCLGYVARASGVDHDARRTHPFHVLTPEVTPPTSTTGDVLARFEVRAHEVSASAALLSRLLDGAAVRDAAIESPGPSGTSGAGLGLVEGWRGTIVHRVEIAADGTVSRLKIVDPSFLTWPAVPVALADTIVPDFPLTNKSFNLSYAGNDL